MAEQAESKSDRFKRLATKRVRNAIGKIELIGKLSSSAYESTSEEVEKIISALQEAVDNVKARFSKQSPKRSGFQL